MIKTYKSFFIIFIITMVILLYFLKKYNDIIRKDQTDILVSKTIDFINSEISYQKKHALTLAILFSKNQNIIGLLEENKRKELKTELNTLIKTIFNYTKLQNIQIQVHTKDLKVFVRTWEDKYTGLNLGSFRQGLVKVKNTKQPFVSNELGKRFNIKAISPIFNKDNQYIGSLEVIMDYTSLKKRLEVAGIELLPLLKSKFLNIAEYHKGNNHIGEYVLIEKNYNKKLYDILLHNSEIFEGKKFYYEVGGKLVTMIPFANIDGEIVSYFAASFEKIDGDINYLSKYEYPAGFVDNKAGNSNTLNKNIIIK